MNTSQQIQESQNNQITQSVTDSMLKEESFFSSQDFKYYTKQLKMLQETIDTQRFETPIPIKKAILMDESVFKNEDDYRMYLDEINEKMGEIESIDIPSFEEGNTEDEVDNYESIETIKTQLKKAVDSSSPSMLPIKQSKFAIPHHYNHYANQHKELKSIAKNGLEAKVSGIFQVLLQPNSFKSQDNYLKYLNDTITLMKQAKGTIHSSLYNQSQPDVGSKNMQAFGNLNKAVQQAQEETQSFSGYISEHSMEEEIATKNTFEHFIQTSQSGISERLSEAFINNTSSQKDGTTLIQILTQERSNAQLGRNFSMQQSNTSNIVNILPKSDRSKGIKKDNEVIQVKQKELKR